MCIRIHMEHNADPRSGLQNLRIRITNTWWEHDDVGVLTWVSLTVVSMLWRMEMEKVAVLPVPDCACAITSLPCKEIHLKSHFKTEPEVPVRYKNL